MSSSVLKRLLTRKDIVQNISFEEYKQKNLAIYSIDCPANFFCLILEGCMEVEIGREALKFESRSFSYFGAQALNYARDSCPSDFRPDFTTRPLSDCLVIIVTQSQYSDARKASVFEGERNNPPSFRPGGSGGSGGSVSGGLGEKSEKDNVFTEQAKAEPVQKSKGSGFSQFSFFLSKHSEPKKSSPSSRKSDQLRLLSINGGSDLGSPVNANSVFGSPAEVKVDLDNDGNHGTRSLETNLSKHSADSRTSKEDTDLVYRSTQV